MNEAGRARQFLLDSLGRPLLLVFWSVVLWGSLMALGYAQLMVRSGFELRVLLPPAGAEDGLWAGLNLGSAVLAVCAWVLGGFAIWQGRRRRG